MSTDLVRLQDDVDDAVAENRAYRRGMFWIVAFGLACIAAFAAGTTVGMVSANTPGDADLGNWVVGLVWFGGLGTGATWCTGVGWWNYYNHVTWIDSRHAPGELESFHHSTSQIDNPARRIVNARRALRDGQDGVVRTYPITRGST